MQQSPGCGIHIFYFSRVKKNVLPAKMFYQHTVTFLVEVVYMHNFSQFTSTEQEQDKVRLSEELSKSRDRVKSLQMIGKNYRDKGGLNS